MLTFAVDLRSDTVTRPDAAMRAAMAAAEVGDDVLEGDPTVRRLEERVAELLGKAGGVFVASGTMGNLVAQLAHRVAGRAILCGPDTHVNRWEGGGHAAVTGAALALVDEDDRGVPEPGAVAARCAVDDPHVPLVGLGWVENSHGGRGGMPVTADAVRDLRAALPSNLPLHHDGARLLDAAVALDTTMAALVADADSSTLCLSKGLGCPVGTVVVGSPEFVREARRARKLVGGAMRQSGILAAAGLHVLEADGWEHTRAAVAESHAAAATLARTLAGLPGATDVHDAARAFNASAVTTNIVRFGVDADHVAGGRDAVVRDLAGLGVGVLPYGTGIRAVTHRGLGAGDAERVSEALASLLA